MTEPSAKPTIVRKVVVIFDVCSSTAILEDLLRTENHVAWQSVLGHLKRFFWSHGIGKSQMYKFLGDGWILLFDDQEISGSSLISLLNELSTEYDRLFRKYVETVLSNMPDNIGLTFGVDEGSLVKIVMNKQKEYVGRAINVAARLQAATKKIDGPTAGTLLISTNAYARLKLPVKGKLVVCDLANVAGGTRYRARMVRLAK
ncbi:MAG: hypothetical protein OEW48_18740 [Phycisphaerae bacterium]|nr:hypothetical protein [Phycisphaerae bacterium]